MEQFRDFLEARKELLAGELNRRMEELLHGETKWLASAATPLSTGASVRGAILSEEEEHELEDLNDWVAAHGLPRGEVSYDFADAESGQQLAVFDLAWPSGIQEELSQPAAVLVNAEAAIITLASQAGFKCFTDASSFRRYVEREVLGVAA